MSTVTDPQPQIDAGADLEPVARAGRTELGMISIADQVVTKIAACAATEHPDAGAAAIRHRRRERFASIWDRFGKVQRASNS